MNLKPTSVNLHPASSKLSIRKNRQLLKQSKNNTLNIYCRESAPLYSSRKINQPPFMDTSKIIIYPHNYSPDRYRFKKGQVKEEGGLCGCISDIENTNAQIYISPSQAIFRQQFMRDSQCSLCLTTKIKA